MSVLLVNVGQTQAWHTGLAAPNLGLAYLAATLLEAGFETHMVDLLLDPINEDELLAALPALGVRLVGISTMTASYPQALALARRMRHHFPELPLVIGGSHATFLDADTLTDGCFDVVVRYEGELILRDLARHFLEGWGELSDIGGITFPDGKGGVIRTPRRAPIADLDGLPLPARHLAPLDHYAKLGVKNVGLMTSRGCLYRCTFCNNEKFNPPRRKRTIDGCVAEIDALIPLGFDLFHFWDEDLFANPRWAHGLMARIAERHIRWAALIAATDKVDRALIQDFKDSGGVGLFIGAESADDEVLASTRRPNRLATILRVADDVLAVGIPLEVGLIIGHPADTPASVHKTGALATAMARLGVSVHITINTPFPGTYQYDNAEELGLRIVDRDWSHYDFGHAVMDTRNLSAFEIEAYAKSILVEVNCESPTMQSMLRILASR